MAGLSDFDRVRIVNLPERSDRRRQMRKQLALAGLTGANVSFSEAVRPDHAGPFTSRGMFGSFLSHKHIIDEAAAADQSVLILEDDCNFLPMAKGYQIPACDVFYGSHSQDAEEMIGAHCMGLSAAAARLASDYLVDYTSPRFVPDTRAAADPGYNPAIRPPIDGAYVWFRRAHPQLVTHFAYLTYQRPSRSDCTPSHRLDKIPVVRDVVEFGRRVREAIA